MLVKGGGVIERLGAARTVLLDKTGTLTLGTPSVERIVSLDGLDSDEILRLAASLDQLSAHVLGEALVHDAERRGLKLKQPTRVTESPGEGIEGEEGGDRVAVGGIHWLAQRGVEVAQAIDDQEAAGEEGLARVVVAIDGRATGVIVMGDRLRPDAPAMITALKGAGINNVAIVTGDRAAIADAIGRRVGVDRVYSEQTPESKLDVVRSVREREDLRPVVMVGDGVNDAPALALADVGVAIGTAAATISAETADGVITVDRIDRLADAVRIGRRTLRIAPQNIVVGIGLSTVAMAFAAAGFIVPVVGALLQEAIDVAVIVNALRELRE